MFKRTLLGALTIIMVASAGQSAWAARSQGNAVPQVTSTVAETGPSRPPIGWVEFCRREPAECGSYDPAPRLVTLSTQTWKRLVAINTQVNREIHPITDAEQWGSIERWDIPRNGKGDCEDYVLLKRKRLAQAGFPLTALLVTVVIDRRGDGHAVLTVRTDRGDFVLDNQHPQVLPWASTEYRFVKRQSQDNPNRWVGLNDADPSVAVARN
jgi:predicted transglutaminase-like cysteine proteinase